MTSHSAEEATAFPMSLICSSILKDLCMLHEERPETTTSSMVKMTDGSTEANPEEAPPQVRAASGQPDETAPPAHIVSGNIVQVAHQMDAIDLTASLSPSTTTPLPSSNTTTPPPKESANDSRNGSEFEPSSFIRSSEPSSSDTDPAKSFTACCAIDCGYCGHCRY